MKKIQIASLFAILLTLSSCDLIMGIFEAGVWIGVLMVVVVIALVIFIIAKIMG